MKKKVFYMTIALSEDLIRGPVKALADTLKREIAEGERKLLILVLQSRRGMRGEK